MRVGPLLRGDTFPREDGLKWANSGSDEPLRGRRPTMAQGTAVAESRKVGDAGLVTVGIDVSDRYSQLCVLGDDGEIVREERVRTTTAALTRALARMPGARVVLEVGPRSPWLSRMFSELGHDVIVANPRQVKLIARSQRCAVYGPRGRGPTSDAAARRRRYARSAVAAPRIRGPDPSRRTRCPHCGVTEGVGEVALSDSDGCDFVEIRERAGHLNSLKPSSLCRCLTTLCSRGLVTRSEDYAPGAWSWSGRLAPAHRRPAPTRTGHRRGQGCDRIADTL